MNKIQDRAEGIITDFLSEELGTEIDLSDRQHAASVARELYLRLSAAGAIAPPPKVTTITGIVRGDFVEFYDEDAHAISVVTGRKVYQTQGGRSNVGIPEHEIPRLQMEGLHKNYEIILTHGELA